MGIARNFVYYPPSEDSDSHLVPPVVYRDRLCRTALQESLRPSSKPPPPAGILSQRKTKKNTDVLPRLLVPAPDRNRTRPLALVVSNIGALNALHY
jgi:hypothetical protein